MICYKKILPVICLLLIMAIGRVYAQPDADTSISVTDSISLADAVADFIKAMEKKNETQVREMSLDSVHCIYCNRDTSPLRHMANKYMVSVDTFINYLFDGIMDSRIVKSYHERGIKLHILPYKQFYPGGNGKHNVYEAGIDTYMPGEIAPGHEGATHYLQFVKVGQGFRFFGLSSVP